MGIELREINMKNFHTCLDLELREVQKRFVASNLYSIAEAKADGVSIPLAIYEEDTMVGFTMYWFDRDNQMGWIDRLMVDVKYQGRGYGRDAMKEVIRRLKLHKSCRLIRTSFDPDNETAWSLYQSLGFKKTGEIVEGEVVCVLQVKEE